MRHILDVSDLNSVMREAVAFLTTGKAHARWQIGVRTVDGSSSLEELRPHRRALWWRSSRARLQLREPVSLHGIRAAYLSGEPARHHHLPSCTQREALSLGHSRFGSTQHTGRCERSARLAHLCAVRAASDPHCASALHRRALRLDLKNTVYALDSTTIDLCLALFPWAPFRSTKAAIKLHTLIDLRGNIPSFIHISDGKLHDVNVLDELLPEPGAFYVMDRGYLDFERLHRLHLAGAFFVTRAKS